MSKTVKLSLLLFSLTLMLMAALMSGVIKSDHWSVNNIELEAEFNRVNSEQIRVAVAAYSERSFFKIKVAEIRKNLAKIPWVQQVSVNKKWPNTLIISVQEHDAAAVWNDRQLLNEKGEIFEVSRLDNLSALPKIYGKDSHSVKIWDKYLRYSKIVKNTGNTIQTTHVTERGGWTLLLSNGSQVFLGSKHIDSRLVRLADTWLKLINLKEQLPQTIDLRYTNGYVVTWDERIHNKSKKIESESHYQNAMIAHEFDALRKPRKGLIANPMTSACSDFLCTLEASVIKQFSLSEFGYKQSMKNANG